MNNSNEQYTGKWCWALGADEDYQSACDTEDEAHAEARARLDEEGSAGIVMKYSIARVVHPLDLISDRMMEHHIEQLVVGMCETASDECGGDDPAIVIDAKDAANLSTIVKEFLRLHASVQRHGIKESVEHAYVVGSP